MLKRTIFFLALLLWFPASYRLGDRVAVRLVEAEVATGGLLLAVAEEDGAISQGPTPWARRGHKAKPVPDRNGRPTRRAQAAKRGAGRSAVPSTAKKAKPHARPRPSRPPGKSGKPGRRRRR